MGDEKLHLFGEYALDTARGCLVCAGRPIHLRPQAYRALQYLAENRGRLVGKDRLIEEVWEGRAVTDDSLVKCLRDVRQALGEVGDLPSDDRGERGNEGERHRHDQQDRRDTRDADVPQPPDRRCECEAEQDRQGGRDEHLAPEIEARNDHHDDDRGQDRRR